MMCCALTRQGALLVEIAGTAYCKISDPEQANLAKGEQQICDDVFTIGWSVTIFWPSQHRKTKTVNTRLKLSRFHWLTLMFLHFWMWNGMKTIQKSMLREKKSVLYINKGMFCAWDSCTTSFSYR